MGSSGDRKPARWALVYLPTEEGLVGKAARGSAPASSQAHTLAQVSAHSGCSKVEPRPLPPTMAPHARRPMSGAGWLRQLHTWKS